MKDEELPQTFHCPACGREVPIGPQGCPHCSSPRKSRSRKGWQQPSSLDGLNLPQEDFDYEDFVRREFGEGKKPSLGLHPVWLWTGLILLGIWIFWSLR
ncbi:MAG: hypothetical protein AAF555_01215 [Verrucomicrobiota bacterium]